jgi:hypothetical protein
MITLEVVAGIAAFVSLNLLLILTSARAPRITRFTVRLLSPITFAGIVAVLLYFSGIAAVIFPFAYLVCALLFTNHRIYTVPVLGDLLYFCVYAVMMLIFTPLYLRLLGCTTIRFGASIFLVPKNAAPAIRDSIGLLRNRDAEMYFRLTEGQHLTFYYTDDEKMDKRSSHRVFLLPVKVIEQGQEAIACFVVQSLMIAAAAPRLNQYRLNQQELAGLRLLSPNMVAWLTKHSFNRSLIDSYQKIVDKQKQTGATTVHPQASPPITDSQTGGAGEKHQDQQQV